jgi:hypothetical protein
MGPPENEQTNPISLRHDGHNRLSNKSICRQPPARKIGSVLASFQHAVAPRSESRATCGTRNPIPYLLPIGKATGSEENQTAMKNMYESNPVSPNRINRMRIPGIPPLFSRPGHIYLLSIWHHTHPVTPAKAGVHPETVRIWISGCPTPQPADGGTSHSTIFARPHAIPSAPTLRFGIRLYSIGHFLCACMERNTKNIKSNPFFFNNKESMQIRRKPADSATESWKLIGNIRPRIRIRLLWILPCS